MADFKDIKSQLENNPTDFNLDAIKSIPEELDKVIDALVEIRAEGTKWGKEQEKVLVSARKYREELEKAGKTIKENENAVTRLSDKIDNATSSIERGLNSITKIIEGGFFNPIDKLGGAWGKADQAANTFGKTVGGNTKAVAQLRDESIKFANDVHIGAKYNSSIKEMIELQQKYVSTVGRNLQISDKQRETLLATSKLMGQNTNEFASRLENMGIGLEKSGDIAAKMFNDASKSGVSFEKYATTVTQNLTKVQSYGFKNGVEGLTAMAKRAAEVNLSINEAFKVSDKIQTGGIEAAIKMGANLQVLGGSFARMGDPMGMLYQGINDMEGLQDRMIKMFSGLGEFVNGQVKISGANRLRVNAAAEAMGISKDEMYNMINRQAVRGRVESQAKNVAALRGDEELRELVLNTATLNKEGQAVVNVNGQEKRLDEISSADKKYLQDLQKNEAEDIKDIAQILRGYTDVQEGFTKEIENKKAQSFANIGKFTKMIYDKMGQTNWILEVIKDAFLAQVLAGAIGNIGRGIGGIGKMFGGRGTAAARGVSSTSGGVSPGTTTDFMYKGGMYSSDATGIRNSSGDLVTGRELRGIQKSSNYLANRGAQVTETGAIKSNMGITLSKSGDVARAARNLKVATGVGGGALAGAFTGLGYLADGSFSGSRDDKTKAWGGTIGSAVLGGIGTAIGGPLGGMIGAELGKFAGEWAGKGISKMVTKARNQKKDELTKALGEDTEKGRAFANLKGDYSKKQLDQIKKALADGTITEGELSERMMKKLAKGGDKDLIEKFGTQGAKAKINKEIDKLNAKIGKGNFNMDTGEFSIENANFGMIEPVAYAKGGKLNGPSDINGPGMPIQGSNIVVGGGEYVVNAEATKRNERLLDRINSGETVKMAEGGIVPKISNIVPNILKSPMAPLSVRAGAGIADAYKRMTEGSDKLEVGPIKLDVSGTIKLDSGGQQVDLNAIINNPAFLTQLSQMIERRLSDNINGGNFKETRKNKRHNF